MAIGEWYEEILSAACSVIAPRVFHQAPTREIARAAGLSLAGLSHYVGEKDELLFPVLGHSLDRLLAELLSATNLLLGMLDGIATRPFPRSADDARALAIEVGALFLHGFLGGSETPGGARPALRKPA